jgi:acylphosphatase
MKVRAHVIITGRVQGVYFRVNTKRKADSLDLKGWVRNLPNERVEAIFEGEEEQVKDALNFCNHGPKGAMVENVDLTWETYTGEYLDFQITH